MSPSMPLVVIAVISLLTGFIAGWGWAAVAYLAAIGLHLLFVHFMEDKQ